MKSWSGHSKENFQWYISIQLWSGTWGFAGLVLPVHKICAVKYSGSRYEELDFRTKFRQAVALQPIYRRDSSNNSQRHAVYGTEHGLGTGSRCYDSQKRYAFQLLWLSQLDFATNDAMTSLSHSRNDSSNEDCRDGRSRHRTENKKSQPVRNHRWKSPEDVDGKRSENNRESIESPDDDSRHMSDPSSTDLSRSGMEDYSRCRTKSCDGEEKSVAIHMVNYRFETAVDFRAYRLHGSLPKYDRTMSKNIAKMSKRVMARAKPYVFDPFDLKSILVFLKNF